MIVNIILFVILKQNKTKLTINKIFKNCKHINNDKKIKNY